MMSLISTLLFVGSAVAHSAVWTIEFDGTTYPARDARMDEQLNAKRIEWTYTNNIGTSGKPEPWQAVTDVLSPGITCGNDPKYPALKAKARAGADVVIHWSGMIRMHNGPVLTYLGLIPTPETKVQDVKFFKIKGDGYDNKQKKWANEEVLDSNRTDIIKLPSDIKSGTYVLRTELLALHGNNPMLPASFGGPQFYTHCFNVDITGNGTVEPEGVNFPGAYQPKDPGVKFYLGTGGSTWENYPPPGPPVYAGKYDAPSGSPPQVTPAETGVFPEAFQKKYEAYKAKQDAHALGALEKFNSLNTPKGKATADSSSGSLTAISTMSEFAKYMKQQAIDAKVLAKELEELRMEAVILGIAEPGKGENISSGL